MRKLLVIVLILVSNFAIGQQYNFKTYSVDQGLIQSQVISITEDKDGFLWVATLGGGVSRFDGHSFISFSIHDGLPSNHVWTIYCDKKGTIWAGTNEGLAQFKNGKFERIKSAYGLRDDQIWDIAEDLKGNLYFATKNYGVFIYNHVDFQHFAINDGIGFSEVRNLYCDVNGVMWLGSNGYGLAKYDGKGFENVTQKMKLPGLIVSGVYNDKKGDLIAITEEGMYSIKGKIFVPYEKDFDTRAVNAVVIDKDSTTWYATFGNGLISEDINGKMKYFNEDNGLPVNYILCLYIGSSGKMWVGTNGAGFTRFEGERFVHFNKSNILPNNFVTSIVATPDSSYWFATENGITRYYPSTGKTKQYNSENGLISQMVICLEVSPDGIVWAGTENGLVRIIPGTEKDEIKNFPLEGRIFALEAEDKNKIWIGTGEGILYCNGNEIYKRFRDSIPNTRVHRIKKGLQGEILFCTEISFSRYQNKKLFNYKITDSKGSKEITDVQPMTDGTFWLSTNRGLTKVDKELEKIHYTTKDGLSSDNLYLVTWFDGNLWTGGDKGLDRISLDKYGEVQSVKHYDKEDGFIGVECNSGAIWQEDNKLWIGTIKGVTIYQPKYDFQNTNRPKLHLTRVLLNYEEINWKYVFPEMEVVNNIPVSPVLPYDKNNLMFEFIAIDFTNPEKIRYQYMLEGFNSDWLPVTNETSISYTNLPPGDYIFKIRAKNGDGVWSTVLEYPLVIRVPFWKSTLFYVILIPVILILIYTFILLRTRQLNRAKRKLEETVRLRTMELNKQKNELEKLSIVADKMTDGVLICSPDGKIEWINDGFKRMTGFTLEEFLSSELGAIQYLQELSSHKEIHNIIENFKKDRDSVIYDSTHKTKEGSLMWTRAALTPIYNERNDLVKIVALYSDITDHIRYEETLAQTNKDLTDSIVYAKKIQEAILPDRKLMDETFPDYFIYYNPRDIVSGDFYWFTKINGMLVLAVADCTGHGVPGAFMSMIGNEFLHQIINNSSVTHPDLILSQLNRRVTQALHQDGGDTDSRDGMDIAVCTINLTNEFCRFAGAHIPMFLIRNGELIEYDATKESIGGHNENEKTFLLHELNLQKGDCIYFTSDGYVDQFGGSEGKKLMRRRWKEILKRYCHLPMKDQYAMLYELHHDWRGSKKQTDDILIVGIRIT